MRPPAIAELVVGGVIADTRLEDAVLGDLAEEWTERAASDGLRMANRWYWRQAMTTTPHLILGWRKGAPRHAGRRLARAVLGGYLVMVVLTALGDGLLRAVFGPPDVSTHRITAGIAQFAICTTFGLVSGGVAAWFGRAAPLMSALAFAVSYLFVGIVAVITVGATLPVFFWANWLAIVPGAVVVYGSILSTRRAAGR